MLYVTHIVNNIWAFYFADSPEVSIQANRIDGPVGGETRVRNIPQQDF